MLKEYTHLKEVTCVRYADDFKLFTRSYQQAEKLFYAVKGWLKGRLGLDISPEKSNIVNLKETYSEFLGLRIKATNHAVKAALNLLLRAMSGRSRSIKSQQI